MARLSALVGFTVLVGCAGCGSDEAGGTKASGGASNGGGAGGQGAKSGGGAGGSGAVGGGSAGAGTGGAACVKAPSTFAASAKEICNGADDDANGAVDDQQTGWIGFCDPSALVEPSTYTFERKLAEYKTEFDNRWSVDKPKQLANATTCNPCDQQPYYLQGPFKALIAMYRATGETSYLDDAIELADAMIAAADPYDGSGSGAYDQGCFDAWSKTVSGGLKYWSTLDCTPTDASWRYQLNELQGLRGISELAAVLADAGDPRKQKYIDYADQVVSFYAMIGATKDSSGKCQPDPRIDGAADKRSHYAINAIDLYRATGEQRFLDWANKVITSQLSSVIQDDGDYLKLYVTPSDQTVNDVSHANREIELVRTLAEIDQPGSAEHVRRAVNTLLFRIWENDPTIAIDGASAYPYLYKSFVDGSNACSDTNPPYRTGSVTMGWHELGRYDARVLHLIERLTLGMLDNSVPGDFPAAGGCPSNGNTNYSFILPAIAELAYAASRDEKRCGP